MGVHKSIPTGPKISAACQEEPKECQTFDSNQLSPLNELNQFLASDKITVCWAQ